MSVYDFLFVANVIKFKECEYSFPGSAVSQTEQRQSQLLPAFKTKIALIKKKEQKIKGRRCKEEKEKLGVC